MFRVTYKNHVAYISSLHTLAVTDCEFVVRGGGTSLRKMKIETERQKCDLGVLLEAGPLSDRDTAICVHDVLAGLCHLHSRGLIHCDIKPQNILVTMTGRAKLADFDHVQTYSEHTQNCAYSIPYRAPEVHWDGNSARKCPLTPAADMWATGVLLCDITMENNPFMISRFDADDCGVGLISAALGAFHNCRADRADCELPPEIINMTRERMAARIKTGSGAISGLILDMLRPNPADRITSYDALMIARNKAAAYISLPEPPPLVSHRVRTPAAHTEALCAAFREMYPDLQPDGETAAALTKVIYHTRMCDDSPLESVLDKIEPFLAPKLLAAAWGPHQ